MTIQQMTSLPISSPTLVTDLPNDRPKLSKEDIAKLIDFARKEFDRAKSARWKAEKQWYLNLAFYFGRQNVIAQDAPGASRQFKLYVPPAPYWRSRPVINRIRPLIRTEMSKLTSQKPISYIVPASSDERDMFAAQAGEQIWESIWRDKKVPKTLRNAIFWSSITGNGFVKSWWDDTKLDPITNQYGDLCFEKLTPFHLFVPDLREPDIEDQAFVIHAANRNSEQLSLSYPGKIPPGGGASGDLLEESFINVMGIDQNAKNKGDNTLVLEVWVKPGQLKLMPHGGMYTVANDRILDFYDGWPYIHNQYPFAHIRHIETGKFYGDSTIVDLIPLQREYNRTRGQIIEAKNRMAKPQLAAEMGSIDPAKITTEPGQVIMYRPGFQAPQPIPLQSLPSYVLEEQDRITMDMNEVSGQHEVSRGTVPPGVTAATAISYLQEQDESKLSYTYDSIEEAVEKLGYQALCYVKQYWDTPRKVRVTGEDGSFDVKAFEGSDLRDNTDLRVEAGSALPTSRAAKQAYIMDLMKLGFIDPQKGLEVLEIGGIQKIYEQIQIDVRQAQRENLKMAQVTPELLAQHKQEKMQELMSDPKTEQLFVQGLIEIDPQSGDVSAMGQVLEFPLIVPVNSWDNHRIHIERHNNYRKSQAYDNLSPEAKQLFEDHVNAHIQAIMVGAQGAMGLPPETLDMSSAPETFQALEDGSNLEQAPQMPEQGVTQ